MANSSERFDLENRKNASAVPLLVSFCVIASIVGVLAALESSRANDAAEVEQPFDRTLLLLIAVFGFSVYSLLMAAMTVLTSKRWFRSRLSESAAFASGLCIFACAAQAIEPFPRFDQPNIRWMIGVACLLLAIWFAVLWRKQTASPETPRKV